MKLLYIRSYGQCAQFVHDFFISWIVPNLFKPFHCVISYTGPVIFIVIRRPCFFQPPVEYTYENIMISKPFLRSYKLPHSFALDLHICPYYNFSKISIISVVAKTSVYIFSRYFNQHLKLEVGQVS